MNNNAYKLFSKAQKENRSSILHKSNVKIPLIYTRKLSINYTDYILI